MNDSFTLTEDRQPERLLVVLHPTSFCNLDCKYCWAPDRDSTYTMPLDLFETAIERVYEISNLAKVTFCWHSGEPLVPGLEYYQKALAITEELRPSEIDVRYVTQTNATLIDDDWASFFKDHDFTVGVSIDGPKKIHDHQRQYRNGRGSFKRTLRGIETLKRHNVRGGALCVITHETLRYPADDLFYFFHDRSIKWSYLIEASIGENTNATNSLSYEDIPELRSYLERLMELWIEHPDSYIKDFDMLATRLFDPSFNEINLDNTGCLDILSINSDGSFFFGNPELIGALDQRFDNFVHGRVQEDDIEEARQSKSFSKMRREIFAGIEKCKNECPYFAGCHGGNPSHKYYEFDNFDESSHLTCELNEKVINELFVSRLESEVA